MRTTFIIGLAVAALCLTSCVPHAEYGDNGQPCFTNGTCLEGLFCGPGNLCVKPVEASDAGGGDTSAPADADVHQDTGHDVGTDTDVDAGADVSEPSDASDTGADTGTPDAGEDTGSTDAGADAGTDAGCVPDCSGKCGGASDGCTGTCPDPCNGHGTCSAGTCTCTTGYQAPSCNACAAGYSGYPNCTQSAGCGPSPTGKGGEMCDVAAGAFMMGCNTAVDTECQSDENPYHSVTVPAYKIDKYEVTASEYKACVTASGCTAANTGSGCNYNVSGKESHPINCVDWNQAKAYCTWAGKKLPTEAEWEKAARGTDGRKYPWGNDVLDCNRAVHSVSPCSNSGTATVGSKPTGVSPYGAMDMVGNVWEWVEDDWHGDYNGAPANGSAWIDAPRGSSRVLCGGSWFSDDALDLRSSNRTDYYPTFWINYFGFRCSRDGS